MVLDSENAISRASFVQVPSYRSARRQMNQCFVPLDLRVSLNFAHICEQLFKAKFQAIFLDRC